MTGAAVLGAEDLVPPGRGGIEPGLRVPARQDVLLDAEFRHVERMDDVAGSHQQADVASRRDPQDVDRVGAVRIGELPHPLLAHHVDVHRVGGWRLLAHELAVSEEEPEGEEAERNADEERLHPHRRLDVRGGLRLGAAAVADEEEDGGEAHRCGHHEGGEDDEVVQPVDVAGERRRLIGQEEQLAQDLVHAPVPLDGEGRPARADLISRHQRKPNSAASANANPLAPSRSAPTT